MRIIESTLHKQANEVFNLWGIQFDITKAMAIAATLPKHRAVPERSWRFGMIYVNRDHIQKVTFDQPLIFATLFFEGVESRLLIDGNHRVEKALTMNPVPELELVILPLKETMDCIIQHTPASIRMVQQARKAKHLPRTYPVPK